MDCKMYHFQGMILCSQYELLAPTLANLAPMNRCRLVTALKLFLHYKLVTGATVYQAEHKRGIWFHYSRGKPEGHLIAPGKNQC